jgi:hypothetical protein
MGRKHPDCPNCKPGVYRCDRHKHPGRGKRKQLAREKLLDDDQTSSQPVNDKGVIEHRHNEFSRKHQEKKKKKPQHIIIEDDEDFVETRTQAVDPSTVVRFDSSDLEAILTPTIKAVAESVARILISKAIPPSFQVAKPSVVLNDHDDSDDSDESDDSDNEADSERLSERQQKMISPNSFLLSCVSEIRDLVFELLSAPENAAGMTVEDMEGPIRIMMDREKFTIPETWNVIQLLRVIFDQQDHHFFQLVNDKWAATKIPSRELSGRYLNELRAKRCSPTPSPLKHPAMLHIFITRYSSAISISQMEKLDQSFEACIKTTNALFGAGKQQPETKPYAQGTHAYPMHIKCTTSNVQATDLLRNMLARNRNCTIALQELSTHAQQTFKDKKPFEGRFTYRVIISGLDGGSVNNDSWEGLQRAYPRPRGQLLIFDDKGVPAPDSPVVTQESIMDWATPVCLLPNSQSKKDTYKHVVWGMFDMIMLAKEWTRDCTSAPRVTGPLHARIEQDQQLSHMSQASAFQQSPLLLEY